MAVSHGITGVQQWIDERWLPTRLVVLGGFSWTVSKAFEWLLGLIIDFASWLAVSFESVAIPSTFSTQILFLFFVAYVIHSGIQTKLVLGVKTNLVSMTSDGRSGVRTDGGGYDEIWLPVGAIGGIIAGVTIGWSFGMDGMFVGAGIGWVLGDEFDKWFDEKFLGPVHTSRNGEQHVEEQ